MLDDGVWLEDLRCLRFGLQRQSWIDEKIVYAWMPPWCEHCKLCRDKPHVVNGEGALHPNLSDGFVESKTRVWGMRRISQRW
ncbi:hypothetical protein LIER_22819 [Lithospermum erythrorhizon]|uniref:Uncharacterized protein n=1 Tax=Lithospermum erythrorhizon TaxID=34254 RepID=A0AAV3R0Y0_LITER